MGRLRESRNTLFNRPAVYESRQSRPKSQHPALFYSGFSYVGQGESTHTLFGKSQHSSITIGRVRRVKGRAHSPELTWRGFPCQRGPMHTGTFGHGYFPRCISCPLINGLHVLDVCFLRYRRIYFHKTK